MYANNWKQNYEDWAPHHLSHHIKVIHIIPNFYNNYQNEFVPPTNEDELKTFNDFFARKYLTINSMLYDYYVQSIFSKVLTINEVEVKRVGHMKLVLSEIDKYSLQNLVHKVQIDGNCVTIFSKEKGLLSFLYKVESNKRLKCLAVGNRDDD